MISFGQSIERQVIGATGSTITDGSTMTMSFTVGEVITTSLTDGTLIFNQGFQQGETPETLGLTESVILNITLFPNPAIKTIFIKGLKEKALIKIYDINGRLVLKQDNYFNTEINVSHLEPALYFVEVNTGNSAVTKKFIKK